jgi:hypothetical protein
MRCKSLNLEFTAKLYAKIEVAFTVFMAVLKFLNKKSTKNLNYTFVQCQSYTIKSEFSLQATSFDSNSEPSSGLFIEQKNKKI